MNFDLNFLQQEGLRSCNNFHNISFLNSKYPTTRPVQLNCDLKHHSTSSEPFVKQKQNLLICFVLYQLSNKALLPPSACRHHPVYSGQMVTPGWPNLQVNVQCSASSSPGPQHFSDSPLAEIRFSRIIINTNEDLSAIVFLKLYEC